MKMKFPFAILFALFILAAQAQSEYDKNTISIGVVVSDLNTSMDFYTNIIGMEQTGELDLDGSFGAASGLTGGEPLLVKILKFKDSPDAAELKLLSFGNEKTALDEHIQDQNGMQYITIFPKSTKAILKRIQDNNIAFLGKTPIQLPDGRNFILIQDPDGVFIEIIGN